MTLSKASWISVTLLTTAFVASSVGCSGSATDVESDGGADATDSDGADADNSGAAGGADGDAGTGGAAGNCEGGEKIPCTLAVLPSTGDPAQDCVNRINQFREECLCLPPLARWTENEACVDQQAADDSTDPDNAHSHFGACEEWGQCTCPGWGGGTDAIIGGCLQMMWDEGPGGGHHDIMASTDYTQVACGFHDMGDGKIWANQDYK